LSRTLHLPRRYLRPVFEHDTLLFQVGDGGATRRRVFSPPSATSNPLVFGQRKQLGKPSAAATPAAEGFPQLLASSQSGNRDILTITLGGT
jgi:hypothetical protein